MTPTGVVVEGGGGDFSSSLRELPFVGRETPLAALVSAVQAAELGESVVALVAGEPGIGKTRLVREMAARVTCRVLWAVGWEGDGAPAYWPWLQLLRALRSLDHGDGDGPEPNVVHGVDVLMGNAPSSDVNSDARFEVFDAVAEVFALASQRQPLVLVFEDLHWADEASIRLLEFLSRDRRPRRLAMVGTYRDSELDRQHPLARRLAELVTGGLHLTLGGLGRRDVAALVVAMGEDGEGAARIVPLLHRKSGGNPFFLRELVRLLRVEGALDSSMPNVGSAVPAGVRAVVARRLDRLASSTLEVLEAAAAVGTDFDVSLLHAVTGRRTEELLAGLDEAMAAGIVIRAGAGGGFSFVHALVREALYEGLALGTRARLHQELAEVIQAHHGDERPTELAYHVLHSSVSGADERAVECCVRAAEWSLGLLAYEEAAAWYGRALDLLRVHHPGDIREGELLLRLGEAHVAAGDLPAARETYRQAAVIARRRGDAEQLTAAALGLGAGLGGFEVRLQDPMQIELLEEAQAALDPAPSRLRAWVLARLSVALSFVDAEARRLALSEEAVVMARQLGDVAVLGYALAGRCDAVAGPDHCETRLADASEVVRLARKAGDRQLELLGRRLRLVALLEVGDLDRADVEIERFGHVAEQVRQPLYRWYVPLWRGMRALMRGDLDEAARRCAEAEDIGAAAHSANAVVLTFLQWWVRQRYEGRFVEAGTAMAELLGREPSGLPVTAGLRTVAALQAGETDRAKALLEQWLEAWLHQRARDSEWLPDSAQLAEAAVAVGAREVAEVLYDQLRPYAHRFCVEGIGAAFTGSVSWYLALVARFLGHADDAEAYERQARAAHRRVGLVGDPPPLAGAKSRQAPAPSSPEGAAAMVLEGATWAITYAGTTRRLRDSKGLRDLAALLRRPGKEVHCLELMGGADVGSDAGSALDAQARRAYERRIRDLQSDIEDAHAANDPARAERAEVELDALVQQLAEAFGLSGRARATGSAAERARSAVSWRIRAAIRHAAEIHPVLGRHFENAVHTGTWCSYRPETAIAWEISGTQGRSA